MKRWLAWGVGIWVLWIAGLLLVNPSWPAVRTIYVWGWTQIQAWGLDPCRSCPVPDRFK